MDWSTLFRPEVAPLERILRALVVYGFLLMAFRFAGKRELGQMTPFDLVVLLMISSVLQNAMMGDDRSITGGLIGAVTLFAVNGILARLTLRRPRLEQFLVGEPVPLVEDGRVLENNMRRELMTRAELESALRKHELDINADLPRIHRAFLEADGSVSVLKKDRAPCPAG